MSRTIISSAAVLAAIASPALAQTAAAQELPTRAQIAATLESRFKAMDSDGDGKLGKAEIEAANVQMAAAAAAAVAREAEEKFAKVDTDRNGQISLAEYKATFSAPKPTPSDTTLQRLDTDKDQAVSLAEFSAGPLSNFELLDRNKDGKLTAADKPPAGR